jgi:hypothetical protein
MFLHFIQSVFGLKGYSVKKLDLRRKQVRYAVFNVKTVMELAIAKKILDKYHWEISDLQKKYPTEMLPHIETYNMLKLRWELLFKRFIM